MVPAGVWKTLYHNRRDVPKLLVKLAISDDGYDIAVTDLTNVWREMLSHDRVVHRAEESGCSINPGDDSEQFGILLRKIEDAFSLTAGTSIEFDKPENDPDGLLLVATTPLPRPLAPLSWQICLSKSEPTELTTAIVSPTLRLAYEQQKEIQHLLAQLHRKDHVIGKLLDRMESANVHLDSVFPLPNIKFSKKIPQREQFAKHVPGLANFQPGSQTLCHEGDPSSDQLCSVLEKVSVEDSVLLMPKMGWWHTLNNASQLNASLKPAYSMDLDSDETDDDEFQTQDLPAQLKVKEKTITYSPHRWNNQNAAATHHMVDEYVETTDSEESTSSSPRPQQMPALSTLPTMSSQNKPSIRRLGKIGGTRAHKPVLVEQSPEATSSMSPTANNGIASSVTPSIIEITPSVSTVPVKRKLGTLGGRRPSSQTPSQPHQRRTPFLPSAEKEEAPLQFSSVASEDTLPKDDSSSSATVIGRAMLDRDDSRKEPPYQLPETSEELANKRRERLKKELEMKQARVKKKRKF